MNKQKAGLKANGGEEPWFMVMWFVSSVLAMFAALFVLALLIASR